MFTGTSFAIWNETALATQFCFLRYLPLNWLAMFFIQTIHAEIVSPAFCLQRTSAGFQVLMAPSHCISPLAQIPLKHMHAYVCIPLDYMEWESAPHRHCFIGVLYSCQASNTRSWEDVHRLKVMVESHRSCYSFTCSKFIPCENSRHAVYDFRTGLIPRPCVWEWGQFAWYIQFYIWSCAAVKMLTLGLYLFLLQCNARVPKSSCQIQR